MSIFCGLEGLDVVVWLRFSEQFGDGVFPLVLFLQICRRVRIAVRGRSCGNLSEVRIAKRLGNLVGSWADSVGSLPNCFLQTCLALGGRGLRWDFE